MANLFDTWVKRPKPNPNAQLRLFCFPYAGGSASLFRAWADLLPPEVEVCAIQLPGREDRFREAPFTHLAPLVQILAQNLQPALNLPFAFFGHSMGALISFELARQLRQQKQPLPLHLFLSGRRAPDRSDRNPNLHTLPQSEFLAELKHLNGTPAPVLENAELLQLLLPRLRADFSVCGTYHYREEAPLDCAMSVFYGAQDPFEICDLMEGWRRQTRAAFSLQTFPGDHFFLQTSQGPLLKAIAHQLHQSLHPPAFLTHDYPV